MYTEENIHWSRCSIAVEIYYRDEMIGVVSIRRRVAYIGIIESKTKTEEYKGSVKTFSWELRT